MKAQQAVRLFFLLGLSILTGACESNQTFGLGRESNQFSQSGLVTNNKVDIIWIVDGSGTMANHQSNLANNFGAFITDFTSKGFDYRMVVASTDAWVREVNYNGGACAIPPNPSQNPNTNYISSADCQPTLATFGDLTAFRDGDIYGTPAGTPGARSGIYMLTNQMSPSTVASTFAINVRTGVRGDGRREGAFQSLRSVLRRNSDGSAGYGGETHTVLDQFRRPDAFLAVVIISDEEDQSRKQDDSMYATTQEYVDGFTTFMDGYTASNAGNRRYNVSSITITDLNNCPYGLHPQATQGDRHVAIAQASQGVVGSICSTDFSAKLSEISKQILTLSTRFQLSREPNPATITVYVDGAGVPKDPANGWTYKNDNGNYFVEFHGSAVPPQGANVFIDFDPLSIKH